ncbi:hypothetical protein KZZ52_46790 [Dactylosporangium sp. AC04546]|nr:hypothetical protein [Dactylosporangium sp. AC04546]WVK81421.1 hypothetical protein KZZ52_46790 [Dactylosporangium sp. AC04546]
MTAVPHRGGRRTALTDGGLRERSARIRRADGPSPRAAGIGASH